MTRQFGADENGFEFLARDIGEGVELQPRAIILDHRNVGARIALKALAAVEPRTERLQRTRQRLDLADAAAGVWIGEPEVAVGIFARQRLLGRLDRADVLRAEFRDQRIAIGQRLLEQPADSRGRSPGSPGRRRAMTFSSVADSVPKDDTSASFSRPTAFNAAAITSAGEASRSARSSSSAEGSADTDTEATRWARYCVHVPTPLGVTQLHAPDAAR